MKVLSLSDDQKMGLEAIEELFENRRRKFLEAVLVQNGGSLDELWHYDPKDMAFIKHEPDEAATV